MKSMSRKNAWPMQQTIRPQDPFVRLMNAPSARMALTAKCPGCGTRIGMESLCSSVAPGPLLQRNTGPPSVHKGGLGLETHHIEQVLVTSPVCYHRHQEASYSFWTKAVSPFRETVAHSCSVRQQVSSLLDALPQILPEGLGPDLHLQAAHLSLHPCLKDPSPSFLIACAIKCTMHSHDCNSQCESVTVASEVNVYALPNLPKPSLGAPGPCLRPITWFVSNTRTHKPAP